MSLEEEEAAVACKFNVRSLRQLKKGELRYCRNGVLTSTVHTTRTNKECVHTWCPLSSSSGWSDNNTCAYLELPVFIKSSRLHSV